MESLTFEFSNKPLYYYSLEVNTKEESGYGLWDSYEEACRHHAGKATANYRSPFFQEKVTEISLNRTLKPITRIHKSWHEDDRYYARIDKIFSHMTGVSNTTLEKITIGNQIENPSDFDKEIEVESNVLTHGYFAQQDKRIEYIHNYFVNFAPVLAPSKLEKLKELRCFPKNPPILSEDFPIGVYMTAKVYVPIGSKETYQNAPYWKNFWSIEECDFPSSIINNTANEANSTSVIARNGSICILSKSKNDMVRVFNIQGSLVAKTKKDTINNLPKGLYIVTVGDKTFKISL